MEHNLIGVSVTKNHDQARREKKLKKVLGFEWGLTETSIKGSYL